ncbi:hypothetical protein COB64_04555 [Candidatus Wolfebacteria bacterium]|nr:MAG: hypothetical protein COB64_04555 [Candidatus Wolfebacteria bacterium]
MKDKLGTVKFLANKSKELIEKQVSSYRQQNSYAGTIIGISAFFIPLFLNGLEGSFKWIQVASLIPIGLFVWVMLLMLGVLRSRPLFQAFSVDKYQQLVNKELQEVLVFELGANIDSFRDNDSITRGVSRKFDLGIRAVTFAILISTSLLLINAFFKPKKDIEPIKVELINSHPHDTQ